MSGVHACPPSQAVIKFVILDTQPVVSMGLASLISSQSHYRISGTAETIDAALQLVELHSPNLVITGLRFDEATGLQLIHTLRDRWHHIPILVFATCDELVFAERVLRAGANGYLMTTAKPQEILDAIRQILQGEIHVSPQVASGLMHSLVNGGNHQSQLARLSDREIEVYELIGRGLSIRQIARIFRRSTKTIEAHREHIKLKLGLATSQDLAHHAAQWMLCNVNPAASPIPSVSNLTPPVVTSSQLTLPADSLR